MVSATVPPAGTRLTIQRQPGKKWVERSLKTKNKKQKQNINTLLHPFTKRESWFPPSIFILYMGFKRVSIWFLLKFKKK
jgi:hypothetical protein